MAKRKKSRLKVSKGILSLIVAGTITLGATGLIGGLTLKHQQAAEQPKAEVKKGSIQDLY